MPAPGVPRSSGQDVRPDPVDSGGVRIGKDGRGPRPPLPGRRLRVIARQVVKQLAPDPDQSAVLVLGHQHHGSWLRAASMPAPARFQPQTIVCLRSWSMSIAPIPTAPNRWTIEAENATKTPKVSLPNRARSPNAPWTSTGSGRRKLVLHREAVDVNPSSRVSKSSGVLDHQQQECRSEDERRGDRAQGRQLIEGPAQRVLKTDRRRNSAGKMRSKKNTQRTQRSRTARMSTQ